MKSKFLCLLTVGLIFYSTKHIAQVNSYSFTQSSTSYGARSTGTAIGNTFQDDDVNTVTLPFPFTFNGVTQSTINVCSNGYLSFNALSGSEYSPISDLSTQNLISAFGCDILMGSFITADIAIGSSSLTNCSSVIGLSIGDVLDDQLGDFSSNPIITNIVGNTIILNQNALTTNIGSYFGFFNGYIKQSVSGTTPNRIIEFEFANFSTLSSSQDESINFKVKLYETSNKIEFVYGSFVSLYASEQPEVGLKGSINSDYNSRKVIAPTLWSNSIPSTSSNDYCQFDLITLPSSGQSYMWTIVPCTIPVLSATSSKSVSCPGETIILTPSGASSYTWVGGGPTPQQTITLSQTIVLTLIGANGTCTSSITYTQVVAANPTLSIASQNLLICKGQSTTFTASGATSYSWNGVSGTAQNTVMPNLTTTYTLSGSNGTCVSKQTITQNVAASPTLTISQPNASICIGQSATLTASGATSYSWNGVSATAQNIVMPNVTTIYTLAGSNGTCASTQTITQNVAATPTLIISQPNGTICIGQSATLTASGATSYTWNGVAGSSILIVTPSVTTSYTLVGSNVGCSAIQSVVQSVSKCTDINENSSLIESLIAYPNPFNSSFNLRNSADDVQTVVISDAVGKVVYTAKIAAKTTETFSTETLKSGMYFITVTGSNEAFTKKIVKE